jgi:hypothetical protein
MKLSDSRKMRSRKSTIEKQVGWFSTTESRFQAIPIRTLWISLFVLAALAAEADEARLEPMDQWPQWRGPLATGVAPHGDPPTTWSEHDNVRWVLAGVVDQDVDRHLADALGERLHRRGRAHVDELQAGPVIAGGEPDAVLGPPPAFLGATEQPDLGAETGESVGRGLAEAGVGAGDQATLAGEVDIEVAGAEGAPVEPETGAIKGEEDAGVGQSGQQPGGDVAHSCIFA